MLLLTSSQALPSIFNESKVKLALTWRQWCASPYILSLLVVKIMCDLTFNVHTCIISTCTCACGMECNANAVYIHGLNLVFRSYFTNRSQA